MDYEWNEIRTKLRKYHLDETIKWINRISNEIFARQNVGEINGAERLTVPFFVKNTSIIQNRDILIMSWSMVDLAYYMIMASNDYCGRSVRTKEDIYSLHLFVDGYKSSLEEAFLSENNSDVDFYMYLWGFAGEQFKFEQLQNVIENLCRELYILFKVNNDSFFDIEEILKDEVNLPWKSIMVYLMVTWFGFTQHDTFAEIEASVNWKDEMDRKSFSKLIRRYVADYKEIRESRLGRQILYAKPYVRTSLNEIISISPYLNLFLMEHCILWIVRDYYKRIGKRDFTSFYGQLFEKYFEELLQITLNSNEYERVIESKEGERADWKISIDGCHFLVEQKSTILRLSVKQQQTDIEGIKQFAIKTVIKAINQLDATEKFYGDRKYIKIILLYEDYLKSELLDKIMEMPECHVLNDNYYWLVTIGEMERLLWQAKEDRKLFSKVISEMVNRHLTHSPKGRNLRLILQDNNVADNMYMNDKNMYNYWNEIQELVREKLL